MRIRPLLFTASFIGAVSLTLASAYAGMSAQDFVTKASVANEFEIESSKMALDKSQNSDVKDFAQHMVDDHTQTAEKMKKALDNSNSKAQPAKTLDNKHQKLLAKLDSATPAKFDKKYISMQTDAHKEAVDLFSDYAKNGKDPALKDFAAQTLPTLQDHLSHVEQLKAAR